MVDKRIIFQWLRRNCFKVTIFSLCLIGVILYYNSGSKSNFSRESTKIYRNYAIEQRTKEVKTLHFQKQKQEGHHFVDPSENHMRSLESDAKSEGIDVLMLFSKAKNNWPLRNKFTVMVQSLIEKSSVPLKFHIIGDDVSRDIAKQILEGIKPIDSNGHNYTLVNHNIDEMAKQLHETVKALQDYFSSTTYGDALFFLSVAVHRVMPETMHRAIMLDADLKFYSDIVELYKYFGRFSPNQVIGIANEMSPVYRHTFYLYRNKNKGTKVGDPPPFGKPGFNSGVLLLDLDKMRKSELYNSQINREAIQKLTEKYSFRGHLGDQDFFSLLGMEFDDMFYVLPCSWNRQLCQWWKDKGYESVFPLYNSCKELVNIYHGNCNSPIPDFAG